MVKMPRTILTSFTRLFGFSLIDSTLSHFFYVRLLPEYVVVPVVGQTKKCGRHSESRHVSLLLMALGLALTWD